MKNASGVSQDRPGRKRQRKNWNTRAFFMLCAGGEQPETLAAEALDAEEETSKDLIPRSVRSQVLEQEKRENQYPIMYITLDQLNKLAISQSSHLI